MTPPDIVLRPWEPGRDPVPALTALLHAAYGALAARGFRYLASHQDDATTLKRLQSGRAFVAERDGALVGTVTVRLPPHTSRAPYYHRDDVAIIGQFAVEPSLQGQGLGNRLLALAEYRAREAGVAYAALDTAEGAADLIAWYGRHGYRFVEHFSWVETNYRSVILSKPLNGAGPTVVEVISAGDPLHAQELRLRWEVLRRPLGMPEGSERSPYEAEAIHFVAVLDGRVVGCVLLRREEAADGVGRLFQMAVEEGLRRGGVGRRLVAALEARAVAEGYREVQLHARVVAQGFYEALGYEVFGAAFEQVGIPHRLMRKTVG